jgi:hypothetical protein
MQVVLDFDEELFCNNSITIVIHCRSVDIRYLLAKTASAQPNFPDFGTQVFKAIFVEECSIFHALFFQ